LHYNLHTPDVPTQWVMDHKALEQQKLPTNPPMHGVLLTPPPPHTLVVVIGDGGDDSIGGGDGGRWKVCRQLSSPTHIATIVD